ncbi:MAG: diacylglycerol/lipid kinase family protein [Gemmatimonadaceae bacterium]
MTAKASPPRVVLIANPAAGGGRAGRILPTVQARLARYGARDIQRSCRIGDERTLARRAAEAGAATIIALGGDGTWSHVARGILDAGTDTRLALLAGGTGNDLARNVGAPAGDVDTTLQLAVDGADRRIDVGYVNDTAFVNSCGVGFDVAVIQALPPGGSSLGRSAYLLTAARKLWRYRAISIGKQPYLVIVIGNGARFGGGMLLAPGATIDDGLLDFVAVRDVGPFARARTLLLASSGKHLGLPGRRAHEGSVVRAALRDASSVRG